MTAPATPPIFDGHNDVLLRMHKMARGDVHEKFLEGFERGHLDLPRMRQGGFGGGLFAIFVPSTGGGFNVKDLKGERYDMPLPAPVSLEEALPPALDMMGILFRIERASEGGVSICRTAAEIRDAMARGSLATVLHIEGAESIDREFRSLEVLYSAGLRSIGPVWSRPTDFAHGVPFRFPGGPDTGPGLTDLGRELVRRCNAMGILIDLSHLNEAGFWDVAKLSDAPLVATHSNAHALCESTRNLTDKQLAAIRESRGMVGVNFATCFLRADGQMDAETGLDEVLRHLDHLIEHLGEDAVGFGSDFDGAVIPAPIADAAGLPNLRQAMLDHGFGAELMEKLCWKNWVDVLDRTWGG